MIPQKLTLDTNIISYLAKCEGILPVADTEKGTIEKHRPILKKLIQLRDDGYCELAVSTAILRDTPDGELIMPELRGMIGSYVDLATPAPFEFELVFPMVFVQDDRHKMFSELYPEAKANTKKSNTRKRDVRHLLGHKVADRDIFITTDEKDILKKAEHLQNNWDIKVLSLEGYIKQTRVE